MNGLGAGRDERTRRGGLDERKFRKPKNPFILNSVEG